MFLLFILQYIFVSFTHREKGVVQTFLQHANRYELSFQTSRHSQNHKHSVDEKLRIIASTLFMDYLFFEGLPECVCVVFNCEGCSPVSNNNDYDIYHLLSCDYRYHHVLIIIIIIYHYYFGLVYMGVLRCPAFRMSSPVLVQNM